MPLVLLCVVALAVAGLVLAQLAGRAQLMARAQTAADAAALAGVADNRSAAVQLAVANGAELTGFEAGGGVVRVEVRLGGESAAAAAERAPHVAPALAASLDRASDILGSDLSGSVRLLGPLGAGGIEVSRSLAVRLAVLSHRTGLCRAASGRPVHFTLCPGIHRD